MNKQIFIISCFLMTCICSCKEQSKGDIKDNTENHVEDQQRIDYLNQFNDFLPDYFFDKGSWFGLKLSKNHIGFDKALFLSDSLGYNSKQSLLELTVLKNNQKVNFDIVNKFIPGRLVQEGKSKDITIAFESIFIDYQTTMIAYEQTNIVLS